MARGRRGRPSTSARSRNDNSSDRRVYQRFRDTFFQSSSRDSRGSHARHVSPVRRRSASGRRPRSRSPPQMRRGRSTRSNRSSRSNSSQRMARAHDSASSSPAVVRRRRSSGSLSRRSKSASSGRSEPPAWAKSLLDAVQAKNLEVDNLKVRLDSLKRKTREDEPELKYKSNKKQYKFNLEVKDKFNQIADKAGVDGAIQEIANKGMSLIDSRNKLIAIADRDGWDVVERFEADPLTHNDEEEKKLRSARKEAERAREKSRGKRSNTRYRAGARSFGASQKRATVSGEQGSRGVEFRPATGQLLINPAPEKRAATYRCFGCGRAGHFLKDCKVVSSTK